MPEMVGLMRVICKIQPITPKGILMLEGSNLLSEERTASEIF
jgi:hypothetical protein